MSWKKVSKTVTRVLHLVLQKILVKRVQGLLPINTDTCISRLSFDSTDETNFIFKVSKPDKGELAWYQTSLVASLKGPGCSHLIKALPVPNMMPLINSLLTTAFPEPPAQGSSIHAHGEFRVILFYRLTSHSMVARRVGRRSTKFISPLFRWAVAVKAHTNTKDTSEYT